jgi:hypothetical protein
VSDLQVSGRAVLGGLAAGGAGVLAAFLFIVTGWL